MAPYRFVWLCNNSHYRITVFHELLKGFYSKLRQEDFADWIGLWSTVFANDDPQIVTEAVKDLIQTHTGFPPEIADVRKKITEIVQSVTGEPTDEEYWLILRDAIADGNWGANEQFARLPASLKRYCGSPSWLRDHAKMDADVIDSVIHGQFLKQFPRIKKDQEYHDSLPEPVKQTIAKLFGRMDDTRPLDEFQIAERKNQLTRLLEGA